VGQLDVQLAEIEAARAAQALASADVERVRATGRLAEVLGAEPGEALAVAADEREPAPLPPEEELVARALATRPDLAAAREERARLDAEAALVHRRAWVPNPTVRGFYRQELHEEHIAGGEVSVPLPVWNRDQGTEAALRAAAGGAGVEADRLAREIPRQVHLALVRRAATAGAWTRYRREALPAAAAARDLVERGYAGGYLGLPEVLVQRDRLLQVRGAAVDAWLGLREAEADLIEAVGAAVP
jgi:cobalt-zinc-cadmium efflux system outer membrane protein